MLWRASLRSTAMSSCAKRKNICAFREKWSWEDDNYENVVEFGKTHIRFIKIFNDIHLEDASKAYSRIVI